MPHVSEYDEQLAPADSAFDKWRKRVGIFLAPLVFALVYVSCDTLSPEGRKLASIISGIAILWISEVVPLPVSALFGAALCVILGVADARTVLAYFGDPIIFVFLGGFMIARAMRVHQLDRRIALHFLSIRIVGSSDIGRLAGLGIVTILLSLWVSNTATTAMMLPIGLGMLRAIHTLRVERGEASGEMNPSTWPFATAVMLMTAYAASIGGIGTPIASPPNLIGIALIRKATGLHISFFQWMMLCIPLLMFMAVVLLAMLLLLHRDKNRKPSSVTGDEVLAYIRSEKKHLGAWTTGQINTLIAFSVAVTLWVFPGILALPGMSYEWATNLAEWFKTHLPESIVALIAAVLLFFLPTNVRAGQFTLTWREAQKIDWGTILLFGGGLALGSLMFQTGVAEALGRSLTNQLGAQSVWMLTAMAIVLGIILSETTSNTASANMVIPVIISISQSAGIDPLPPALGACLGASFGFMLPVSTPPNAIVYGSGLVPLSRMMRAGIFFDVIGFLIILGGLRLLYPIVFDQT